MVTNHDLRGGRMAGDMLHEQARFAQTIGMRSCVNARGKVPHKRIESLVQLASLSASNSIWCCAINGSITASSPSPAKT